jgi:DNA-binding Lrp family transcriptional regulator
MKEMSNYGYSEILEQSIIDKINELYITNRKTFLKLNKDGKYSSVSYTTLHDGLIERHIRGFETIGVFSGKEYSKFICFDIDMIEKDKLIWVYHLLMESLQDVGINNNYINVSNSGNKGLHVLLFVEGGTSLKHFKHLFVEVMKLIQENIIKSIKTKLYNNHELKLEIENICNIEFRPSYTQGVKLELGRNFKNKNKKTNECLFVDKDTLQVIQSKDYILDIQPMPKDKFLDLMDSLYDTYANEIEENKSLIKQSITEPYSHKINKDENETINYITNLIQNGLYMAGTRHNSVLKIAKYFRYIGLELEQCIEELYKWMKKQDKKYYSSTLEDALSECERISRVVYEKEYSLVGHIDNLTIYKSELKQIIHIKEKNTKVIFFAMLLHSKRYSLKNGVFYMSYKQIEEMTGLGRKAATNNMNELVELGLIEVVDRNIKQEHTYLKKPNKYKINLTIEQVEDDIVLEVDNSSTTLNYLQLYYESTVKLFSNKELAHLPKRQRVELNSYRQLVS